MLTTKEFYHIPSPSIPTQWRIINIFCEDLLRSARNTFPVYVKVALCHHHGLSCMFIATDILFSSLRDNNLLSSFFHISFDYSVVIKLYNNWLFYSFSFPKTNICHQYYMAIDLNFSWSNQMYRLIMPLSQDQKQLSLLVFSFPENIMCNE